MRIELAWPSTAGMLLLWAEILFAWFAMHYLLATDGMNLRPMPSGRPGKAQVEPPGETDVRYRPLRGLRRIFDSERGYPLQAAIRIIALMILIWMMAGSSADSLPLFILAALFGMALLLGRGKMGLGYGLIALELVVNAGFMALTGFLIGARRLALSDAWIVLPVSEEQLTCLFLLGAALIYLGKGGTYIVRGFLAVAGTMPRFKGEKKPPIRGTMELQYVAERDVWVVSAQQITAGQAADDAIVAGDDRAEFRRGRLIGNMERIVLAMLAAVGSYPAIGFLVAAKGLVRSKEFEDRDYAEYFLVGTLASTTLALATGTALRLLIDKMWIP
jgi:hypothetical protein